MHRVLLAVVFILLLPSYAAPALAHDSTVVVEAIVGEDGWAFIHARLPPGEYQIVAVEGWKPRPVNPKPLLLSFTPDPGFWEKLRGLAVAATSTVYEPRVELLDTPNGVELYAWAPGEPGSRVRVVLEKLEAGTTTSEKKGMLIIVPNNTLVLSYAEKIAELHHSQGLGVKIVTTDEIKRSYKPADEPEGLCKPGKTGPGYDVGLARRIVSMLREAYREDVRYVLIIGGAKDVPPFYYCSPILYELVSPEEAAVPTDYFYADPDYDGLVELAVGRIPFSDPVKLSTYISALESWMKGGAWQEKALLAGGAPFATSLLIGEDAVIKAIMNIASLDLEVDTLLLTMGNYAGTRFTGYIGDYGLYYLVTHGAGNALLDYVPGGLWNYDFEEKLRSTEVPYTTQPGVYLSPACRAGFWDYDLVDPPFKPPSVAASLLERGAAVAYLGFSRIAIEVIDGVTAVDGNVYASLAAADAVLILFTKSLGSAETLGDAWLSALNAYSVMPASSYRAYLVRGQEDIGELVLREAIFLGDPATPNPWRRATTTSTVEPPELVPPPGSIDIGASVLAMPLARYASGTLPAFNPGNATTITIDFDGACPEKVYAWSLYRVYGYYMIGLEHLYSTIEQSVDCTVTITLPQDSPGLIRLLARWGNNYLATYYMIAAGAYLDTSTGTLVIRGLDILETVGDEPILLTVNGATVSTIPGGSTSYTVPLQAIAPLMPDNDAIVSVTPVYRFDKIYGGKLVENELKKLAKLFTVTVPAEDAVILPPFSVQFAEGNTSCTAPAAREKPLTVGADIAAVFAAIGLVAALTIAKRSSSPASL